MKYPTSFTVGGTDVKVVTRTEPLYTFASCPNCNDWRFPVKAGESKACPACGYLATRPVNNMYVLGQYDPTDGTLYHMVSDNPNLKGQLETNFIHEMLEAINSIHDLKMNHTQITTLASSFYQAMNTGDMLKE